MSVPDARDDTNASPPRPLAVQVVRQYAPNRGGLEDVVANLAKQLQARGYRVRIVTLDRLFTDPGRTLPASETIDGVEVVRIPFSGSTRYPIAPAVFRRIRDADIVHVHAIDFFFDALAWGWLLHRKPLVATTHGGFFHTPKHAALKKAWFATVTRLSALGYRRIVGCSAQDTARFETIAPGRVERIDNGAELAKFHDAGSPAPRREIVTIGRFSENKRLNRLLDAMALLAAGEPAWKLHIVGVPGDHSEAAVRQMIAERGLVRNVLLHIALANEAVRDVLSSCSIFASASRYEGFGLVAVEAMSAGLVPVLHPNTAYRDLAARHAAVRLADFDRPDEAAMALEAAYAALGPDATASRAAAMAAARPYAWDQVGESYMRIYERILQSRGTRACIPAAERLPAGQP
ncbi:glycosyltransferase family 4 protein [Rhizobium sp. TRM95111]|uniref:glycosyltransferase family 4 protein n=1 Tax=Rhizobium alarense TaxID=2846851 RepID=UPI001F35C534|nr:glycosyltransferase family 4 protein [Rhizobium alarense]MCF3642667.1 glycosyltransferase family 4 protein [Rhizobium alarense]